MAASRSRPLVTLVLLAAGVAAAQGSASVRLRVGQTRKVDVGRAVGLVCDDVDLVDAKLVTAKDGTRNVLVLTGKREGETDCRAGQATLGQVVLVHVEVEPSGG